MGVGNLRGRTIELSHEEYINEFSGRDILIITFHGPRKCAKLFYYLAYVTIREQNIPQYRVSEGLSILRKEWRAYWVFVPGEWLGRQGWRGRLVASMEWSKNKVIWKAISKIYGCVKWFGGTLCLDLKETFTWILSLSFCG